MSNIYVTRIRWVSAYVVKCRQLHKAYILGSIHEWFLSCKKDATFEVRWPLVAVDKDVGFAKARFAATMKVFVGVGELVELGCGLGSLGIG